MAHPQRKLRLVKAPRFGHPRNVPPVPDPNVGPATPATYRNRGLDWTEHFGSGPPTSSKPPKATHHSFRE
jgi:hypothetical protein